MPCQSHPDLRPTIGLTHHSGKVPMRPLAGPGLTLLLLAMLAAPALAAWPNSPFTNLPLCTAANSQLTPTAVSDGAGGAIVTWYDSRGGATSDIYAQHLLASGGVDLAWPAGGRALCIAANNQAYPTIVSDGAGGAIVTWQDLRGGGTYDIYAQHVLASGGVDPAWPADGRAVCIAANSQTNPTIVSDGIGGAIVTWQDLRGGSSPDIYAQHVLASGGVDPAWPADGRALCIAVNLQTNPTIVSDGTGGAEGPGGAIVTWQDARLGAGYDIYAQHVLGSGGVDPAWPADGRALCIVVGTQSSPTIVSDGASGAIVTWYDSRSGFFRIYAHHVLASGGVDPAWPADGRAMCIAATNQFSPTIVSDGAGGAIVTWYDSRGGATYDIYAQHVLASGGVDSAWPADGRALCIAANNQIYPMIVSDGAGGAIVAWYDLRNGVAYDIYAQHVLASGGVDAAWPTDGRALSIAASSQESPTIVSDGAGGAIVTWQDLRGGTTYDIYTQRVARYGYLGTPEAVIVSANDVPNDQGGRVKVSWNASYLEADPYSLVTYYKVFRSVPPNVVAWLRTTGTRVVRADSDDATSAFDRPGELLSTIAAGTTYYWEYIATVNSDYLANYSYLVPTPGDSAASGAPQTAFMIQARTATSLHWESLPVSGYSVDNLPPSAPVPFTGEYTAGTVALHWNPNTEPDLSGYRLYRGTSLAFVPGPGNLVAALPDTGYTDAVGSPHYYKLTAVDSHGNESLVSTLAPTGTVGVDDLSTPRELSFAPPSPNPAGAATTLRYVLPRAAQVRLAVYDAAGRLVRELATGVRAAGDHSESWDLREANGRTARAGLYFARIESEGRTIVRRVAVAR